MRAAAPLLAAIVLCAGCGIGDPYEERRQAERERELQAAGPGPAAATPQEAVRRVALAWGNWTAETVRQQLGRAIALTAGEASRQLEQQSAHLENGVLEASEPLRSEATLEALNLRGTGERRRAVVVTKETVTGAGELQPVASYQVTLATVERGEQGWVISRWTRQP